MRYRIWVLTCVILFMSTSVIQPGEANAMGKGVRRGLILTAYGAAAGTVVGLASYPAHKSGRGILIGTSIGLILGAVVGVYSALNPDDEGLTELFGEARPSSRTDYPEVFSRGAEARFAVMDNARFAAMPVLRF